MSNYRKTQSKRCMGSLGVITKEGKRLFQKNNDKAKAFFAGSLLQTRKESEPKPKGKPKEKEKAPIGFRRASELSMQG